MATNLNLNIRMDQKLVMTPQLQMAIKLLQMQAIDLQEYVDQEMLENPFLAKEDGMSEQDNAADEAPAKEQDSMEILEGSGMSEEGTVLDCDWDNMYDGGLESSSGMVSGSFDDDEGAWEQMTSDDKSLKDHLTEQLGVSTVDPVITFLGQYLIDAIDDAGYLHSDLSQLPQKLHVKQSKIDEALKLVQSFDPAGVGARDLAECLRLQLAMEGGTTPAEDAVLDNLDLLAVKDLKKISRIGRCSVEEVEEAVEKITSLTPKPGLKYGSDVASTVVPDVVVTKKNGKWVADLNAEAMPKLLLNKSYTSMADTAKGDEKGFMNERMSRAQWLIKSLEQRAKTIYKTANCILTMQEDFFNYGVESLKPMTLKLVAEKVEAHESTISRVTNGKYMQTPMGVFELKYFFSSAIGTTGGNMSVASESVKSMIKRLVGEEDPKKPLSDEKLVTLLKREGVDVARRTVAKYRESLGIPSSSRRRVRV